MFKRILFRLGKRYRTDRKYYDLLEETFGFLPDNIELYKLALIHRSASLHIDDSGLPVNNERLEFLGDAILEAIVSDYLFIEFPDKSEGFLTQIRSKIVSRVSLNDIAVKIGLDKHVIVQYTSNHVQKHLYGDALEALIGAIYLDQGYDFVNRLVINDILRKNLNLERLPQVETDYKSRLIEWCQKHRLKVAFNTLPSAEHHDHNPCFISQIVVEGEPLGTGKGLSKKEAEQQAASHSMGAIRKNRELRERLIALNTRANETIEVAETEAETTSEATASETDSDESLLS